MEVRNKVWLARGFHEWATAKAGVVGVGDEEMKKRRNIETTKRYSSGHPTSHPLLSARCCGRCHTFTSFTHPCDHPRILRRPSSSSSSSSVSWLVFVAVAVCCFCFLLLRLLFPLPSSSSSFFFVPLLPTFPSRKIERSPSLRSHI